MQQGFHFKGGVDFVSLANRVLCLLVWWALGALNKALPIALYYPAPTCSEGYLFTDGVHFGHLAVEPGVFAGMMRSWQRTPRHWRR